MLKEKGFPEAAAALAETTPNTGKKLPRGVFERPSGSNTYWVEVYNGRDRYRKRIGKSLAAARDLAEEMRTKIRNDEFDPEEYGLQRKGAMRVRKLTVKEMFATYLPLREQKVKNMVEERRYADLWTSRFGSILLKDLTALDLQQWQADEMKAGKKASTVNRPLEYLKAYYNLALRDGFCKENPVQKVELLSEDNDRDRFLSEPEEERLAKEMRPEQFDIVLLAIHTGLRRAELFGLRWEFVQIELRYLKIPAAQSKSKQHRTVQLNDTALDVIKRLQERSQGSPWVIPAPTKPTVHQNAQNFVQQFFDPALEKAGIEDFTWHDLRRTFASRLAIAGQSLKAVSDLLGHKDPRVVQRYAHLDKNHLHGVVSSITKKTPPELAEAGGV